jgi:hypothetical protein
MSLLQRVYFLLLCPVFGCKRRFRFV